MKSYRNLSSTEQTLLCSLATSDDFAATASDDNFLELSQARGRVGQVHGSSFVSFSATFDELVRKGLVWTEEDEFSQVYGLTRLGVQVYVGRSIY